MLRLLLLSVCPMILAGSALAADTPVSGKFTGNGKEAKLAFASAHKGEEFAGKPTTVLVFTELDHSKSPKPAFKAAFGDFGSALVLTVQEGGKIVGCEVAHKAHEKGTFSSVGSIAMSDFEAKDGRLKGKVKTDGMVETFKQKWEVDLSFDVKSP